MKIETDKQGRRIYKFSHSVAQGGYVYAHKAQSLISDKEGLRSMLNAISQEFGLIDATIKVYDNIFFFFFMFKPSLVPQKLIDSIQDKIDDFAKWEQEYLFTGVYDLQEKHVREYLRNKGYDYDRG
ncbi:MAG TPA: hypothetical protein HA362_01625 [Nanoarchaeota archaeon]|nr:hypothetical protein [Nanoarchaeota archaeon]